MGALIQQGQNFAISPSTHLWLFDLGDYSVIYGNSVAFES